MYNINVWYKFKYLNKFKSMANFPRKRKLPEQPDTPWPFNVDNLPPMKRQYKDHGQEEIKNETPLHSFKRWRFCTPHNKFTDHKRSQCPVLGFNRIIHNPSKLKEGFTVIREGNRYRRLKARYEPLQIPKTKITVPQYSIIYDGSPIPLPAFKRCKIRSDQWIHSDEEFSEVLSKQLWKSYHTQEEEAKELEIKLGLTTLEEIKEAPNTETITTSDKTSKSKHIKDTPPAQIVDPREHIEEEIKKREIVKARRIPTQDEEEEIIDTTKPKRGRKRKARTS
jgi:hypothetical protein